MERSPIKRYTDDQLAHFIAFIQSPHITTDIPFGERKLKLSSGEKITVPDVIRNIIPSRIIAQYLAYCKETVDGEEFKPLASSSLFAILQKCTASTRKSLAGLDNFSSDGATAFDQLRTLCDEMAAYGKHCVRLSLSSITERFLIPIVSGVKPEDVVYLKQALHDGRNYLKLDFKTHVSISSTIADHCSSFALSDSAHSSWQQSCPHEHEDECVCTKRIFNQTIVSFCRCESCLRLRKTFARLRHILERNTNISNDIRDRLIYRLDHNIQLIVEWKKHLLRTVHQDNARKNILDILDESGIYLVADWAMKWLPTWYREPQREFFGKRGLSWHITYAIRLKPSPCSASSSGQSSSVGTDMRVFEHRTFCHVFDNVKQDGRTVVSILSDVSFELFDIEIVVRFDIVICRC
jgi:hypothetical protein